MIPGTPDHIRRLDHLAPFQHRQSVTDTRYPSHPPDPHGREIPRLVPDERSTLRDRLGGRLPPDRRIHRQHRVKHDSKDERHQQAPQGALDPETDVSDIAPGQPGLLRNRLHRLQGSTTRCSRTFRLSYKIGFPPVTAYTPPFM